MKKTPEDLVQEWEEGVIGHRRFVTNLPWEGEASGEEEVDILAREGLGRTHSILDIGCGSLRVGRWLIPRQRKGNYFGIEPNLWLVYMGIEEELPEGVFEQKEPTFSDNADLDASVFGQKFDYILMCHLLTHCGDKQIKEAISKAAKALAPGGKIICDLYMTGPHYEGDDWLYPLITPHYQKCLEPAAKKAGLKCIPIKGTGITHWFKLEKAK